MLVLRLPHLRHFMAESVDHLCVGPRSEMLGSPVQNLFMKQPRRLSRLSTECKLLVIAQKITPMRVVKPLEFQLVIEFMLKVVTLVKVRNVLETGKVMNPRYIGPFKVLAKVGTVAYRLELPQQSSRVYSTFHVSNLKKCLSDEPLAVLLDEIHIDDKLHFVEEPVEILDCEVKKLRRSRIPIIKVRWNSKRGPEFTWERED
ncbi:hypothetical protein Tco_0352468 [Tanacetum coccineum]